MHRAASILIGMNQRGYIGLLLLLLGTGLALYLFFQYSPIGQGANDGSMSQGIEAKQAAQQVQGMTDERNQMYKDAMNP